MPRQVHIVVLLTLLFALGTPGAHAATAVLENLAGNPTIYEVGEHGARQVSLPRRGASYTLPIEIETGPEDSATFRLPDSEVAIAPNTVMRLAAPEAQRPGLLQRIFQSSGSSLFSVDRQETEHFRVETPYLVSVVKGTLFSVVVHDEGATVSLHEGRLGVETPDGSRSVELLPGDVAYSGSDGELKKLTHTMARQGANGTAGVATTGGADASPATAVTPPVQPATLSGVDAAASELATTASAAGDALADGADSTAGLLDDAADSVGGALADGGIQGIGDPDGDAIPTMVEDAGGGVDELISDVGDTAGDLVSDTGDTAADLIGDTGGIAGDLVGDVADTTGDLTGDVADTAGDLIGDVTDTTGDLAGDVADTTGDLTGDVADSTGDLAGDLADTTGDLTGDVADTTGDIVEDVDDTTEDLTEGLGGALGGIGGLL